MLTINQLSALQGLIKDLPDLHIQNGCIVEETDYWLGRLKILLQQPNKDPKAYIALLDERWQWLIKQHNLHRAYPYTHKEKLTCVFHELAKYVAPFTEHRSAYAVLMPTLKPTSTESYLYHDITQAKIDDLPLFAVVLSDDLRSLIEVEFSLLSASEDGVMKHAYTVGKIEKRLTATETARVVRQSPHTIKLFDAIKERMAKKRGMRSFGLALKELQQGLEEGGAIYKNVKISLQSLQCTWEDLRKELRIGKTRIQDILIDAWGDTVALKRLLDKVKYGEQSIETNGVDDEFGESAKQAISQFSAWLHALDQDEKEYIFSLGYVLTDAEKRRGIQARTFRDIWKDIETPGKDLTQQRYCVEVLAAEIDRILQDNPEVYTRFPRKQQLDENHSIGTRHAKEAERVYQQSIKEIGAALGKPDIYVVNTDYSSMCGLHGVVNTRADLERVLDHVPETARLEVIQRLGDRVTSILCDRWVATTMLRLAEKDRPCMLDLLINCLPRIVQDAEDYVLLVSRLTGDTRLQLKKPQDMTRLLQVLCDFFDKYPGHDALREALGRLGEAMYQKLQRSHSSSRSSTTSIFTDVQQVVSGWFRVLNGQSNAIQQQQSNEHH